MLHPLSSAGGCLVLLIALIFLMVGGDTGRLASHRSAYCMGLKGNGVFGCALRSWCSFLYTSKAWGVWSFLCKWRQFPSLLLHVLSAQDQSVMASDRWILRFYEMHHDLNEFEISLYANMISVGLWFQIKGIPFALILVFLSPTQVICLLLSIWVKFMSWTCCSWAF